MKNKFVWTIVFYLIHICIAKSQQTGIIKYKMDYQDFVFGTNYSANLIIYFDGKKSIEMFIPKQQVNKQINANTEVVVVNSKRNHFILKNFSSNRIDLSDNVSGVKYYIQDTLPKFNWKIVKETKKILNYNCTRAITRFRGRNYVAWFTEDISIQNGPWKFCGLPGLIMMVSDEKNIFTYEITAIDFRGKFDAKILAVPKAYIKDKAISHQEFMGLYKKKIVDYAKLSKVVQTTKDGSSGKITISLPEKMEKF